MKKASPAEVWSRWRDYFVPFSQAALEVPRWIVPGLLVPGLQVLAGEPKTFKSLLALCIGAAVADGDAVRNFRDRKGQQARAVRRGTVLYGAYEQGVGKLRHIYETRVLKRKLKPAQTHMMWIASPWTWQLDVPEEDRDYVQLIEEVAPPLLIIDPWTHAHSLDENDAHSVKPLIKLREAAHRKGTAVLLVHHMNKKKGEQGSGGNGGQFAGFDRVRGTSALWGLCDAGHLVTKGSNNALYYTSDFKDFPGRTWTWRPP